VQRFGQFLVHGDMLKICWPIKFSSHKSLGSVSTTSISSFLFRRTKSVVSRVGSGVVGYCRGLVVAGPQVGLPTKQPDVSKLPSQSKAN